MAAVQPPLPLRSIASWTLPLSLQAPLPLHAAAPAKRLGLAAAQPLVLPGAGGVLGEGGLLLSLLRLGLASIDACTSAKDRARLRGA